ncbi:TonB-dependent receptor [Terrimonas sp. NA20]|uniref:TonB-dependent receptor n=1 Tax=Terrimonas ginsenosidimutans TaxID=2908004 RepID=A0ABS9KQE6_9BACT|nr:TonB-dependent receptor [Terrimonas ginsenosidimutans]MCG2614537.1 TonB-dependent receptor [Terrimonas ginsenosidimutans]
MKKRTILLVLKVLISAAAFSQEGADTARLLEEVTVRTFGQYRKLSEAGVPVRIIDVNNGDLYNRSSLVNSFNTIAGVRMEERSPGSYRINIRGSSLRSPFGVRNVKVYWNDIPVTDPGGNTYFNQFAWNNFSSLEVFKGPASSLYGAGTGGLVLINNLDQWQPGISVDYITGSYNLQNIFASARFGKDENKNQFTYAHNQSDGFRDQSAMRRDNFSWLSQLKLSDKHELSATVLFTDMQYQTPGALTLAEYNTDPLAARPAAGGFPGAEQARATIYQKNILAGFTSKYQISSSLRNATTLYGAFSQIKNPTIRNYERRNEPSYGGRTTFTWKNAQWAINGGAEFQQGYFNTQVARSRNGNPDTLQTNDDINYQNLSVFLQGDWSMEGKWFIQAGLSLNRTNVTFSRLSSYPVVQQSRSYKNELAPRISIMRKVGARLSFFGTVSRGFSPPTVAELLPSTGVISTDLEAEEGWNYEMTARYLLLQNKLRIEATAFYFRLNNALVQRRDAAGADFFVNAGDVKQKGIESHVDYTFQPLHSKLISYITINADYTYNHFRYGSFIKGTDNFSGRQVPSVPKGTFAAMTDLRLKSGFFINVNFYASSSIFLNDANTATAQSYQLLGSRIGWKAPGRKKIGYSIHTGVDNLLDQQYSLGNDINAAAGRYYNVAAGRNFYAGVSFQLNTKQ